MKNIILTTLLTLSVLMGFSQDTPPSGLKAISNSMWLNTLDSAIWINKGFPYGWNRVARYSDISAVVGSGFVPTTRTLTNGFGILAIGSLSENRTISADSAFLRTVLNSYTKAQTNTQISTAITNAYVNNDLKLWNTTGVVNSGSIIRFHNGSNIPEAIIKNEIINSTTGNLFVQVRTSNTSGDGGLTTLLSFMGGASYYSMFTGGVRFPTSGFVFSNGTGSNSTYRTAVQVLTDIGAAPLASPAFTGTTKVTVVEYADNAAAITGGLAVGSVYRTGDILKIVH